MLIWLVPHASLYTWKVQICFSRWPRSSPKMSTSLSCSAIGAIPLWFHLNEMKPVWAYRHLLICGTHNMLNFYYLGLLILAKIPCNYYFYWFKCRFPKIFHHTQRIRSHRRSYGLYLFNSFLHPILLTSNNMSLI